jgi:amicyanin
MNSKFASFGLIAAVLVLGIGGVIAFAISQQDSSSSQSSTGQAESSSHDHSEGNHHGEEAAVEANEVKIENFEYVPEAIEVKVGTTVTWTNNDSVPHTVTSEEGGAMVMDSALLKKGESYSVTFDEAGTFPYFCKPHTYMKGTVVVTE